MLRAVFLVFACVIPAASQSQPPTPSPSEMSTPQQEGTRNTQQPTDENKRGTDKPPLVVKIAPSPETDAKSEQEKKERQKAAFNNQIVSTFAVIFAGISAIISAFALVAARSALHKSQRPWVVADSITLREPILFDVRGPYEINANVTLKNTGVSLAKNVLMWVKLVPNRGNAMAKDWQDLEGFNRHKKIAEESLWPLGVIIAPNQSVSLPHGWGPGNAATVEEIRNGVFYLMGYVEYFDQFEKRHHTRFAFNPNGDSVHPWDKKTFVISGAFHQAD